MYTTRGPGHLVFGRNLVSANIGEYRDDGSLTGSTSGWEHAIVSPNNNPGFVDPAGDDFRLADGSAAIDARSGDIATVPAAYRSTQQYVRHLLGQARAVIGSAADLGAFEGPGDMAGSGGSVGGSGSGGTTGGGSSGGGTGGGSTGGGGSGNPPPVVNYGPGGPLAADASFDLGGSSAGASCSGNVACVSAGASIQAAIDAAADGGIIQVAAGTYQENLAIDNKTVTLLGGFPAGGDFSSRDPLANPTILVGDGSNSTLGLYASGSTLVDGFVIRGGVGNVVYGGSGGGVFIYQGTPRISHNILENNDVAATNGFGGGIYAQDADVEIIGNVVRNNRAERGAGVAVNSNSALIQENLIENNEGFGDHGGGVFLSGPNLQVLRNIIRGNTVGQALGYGWGGGVIVVSPGTFAHFEHNRITDNHSHTRGSGVFIDEAARAELVGDLIYANRCASDGSGIYVDGHYDGTGSEVTIVNVTVADHECVGDGVGGEGLHVVGGSTATVINSIFHNNGGDDVLVCTSPSTQFCEGDSPSSMSLTYSLVESGFPGTGNISADPLFVNSAAQDYHLRAGSPAIDAADPASSVGDEPAPNGGRRNMGAYGGTAAAAPS